MTSDILHRGVLSARRRLLACAAGAVMALGQAPLGLWPATLAGFAALVWLLGRVSGPRAGAWTALCGGAGYFALALSWIVEPFLIDIARHGWMAPFALVLMAVGLALFWAAAGAVAALATGPRRAVLFALALTAAELARGHVLTGFPWAMPGHVWVGWAPAQMAALIGPTGLTGLTLLAAALPVAFHWRGLAGAALLLAAMMGYGQWQLARPDPVLREATLRLVQPNADQRTKWQPGMVEMLFDRQLEYTAALPRPDLVIWPETAVPWLLDDAPGALQAIAEAGAGVPVAVGIQRAEGLRYFNSLAVIGPDASVQALYDKHHLVPFGEYIPYGDTMADWFGITAFATQEGNGYSPGAGAAVLDLGPALGKMLPLICYEAVFPQDLRAAPGRADWILQITNDGWFGTLTGPYQHLAQARLRAIEQGLPLVRVANTGVSALIDARGRVITQIPLGKAAYRDVTLPGALPATPYARFGEWPVMGLLLAGLALMLLFRRRA